jgi:ribosomal protein S27AE
VAKEALMSQMNCPRCGLNVSFKRIEKTSEREFCPRCLARSYGTLSVALRSGTAPISLKREDRVRMLLRRYSPRKYAPRKVTI